MLFGQLYAFVVIAVVCWFQVTLQTPLCLASGFGHDEVVRLLLQRGAKIDHKVGTADLSCRVYAPSSLLSCDSVLCVDGRPAMQCPPFVCVQDVNGQTALYSASSRNHIKVVEALLVRVDAGLWLWFCLVTHSPAYFSKCCSQHR